MPGTCKHPEDAWENATVIVCGRCGAMYDEDWTPEQPYRLGVAHRSTRRLRLRLPEPLPLDPVPVPLGNFGEVFADSVLAAVAHFRLGPENFAAASPEGEDD